MKKFYAVIFCLLSAMQLLAQCPVMIDNPIILPTDLQRLVQFQISHDFKLTPLVPTTPKIYSLSLNHAWVKDGGCANADTTPYITSTFNLYGVDSIKENGVTNYGQLGNYPVTIPETFISSYPFENTANALAACTSRSHANTFIRVDANTNPSGCLQTFGYAQAIISACKSEAYSFCISGLTFVDNVNLAKGDIAWDGLIYKKSGGKGTTITQKGGSNDPVVYSLHDSTTNLDTSGTLISIRLTYTIPSDTITRQDYWRNDSLHIESKEAEFKIIFPSPTLILSTDTGSYLVTVASGVVTQVLKTGVFISDSLPQVGDSVPLNLHIRDSVNFNYDLSSLYAPGDAVEIKIFMYNNCENVSVMDSTVVAPILNPTNPSTPGGSNGAISVTLSGSGSPYIYMWNNGATTSTITGLVAGVYTVTVINTFGCTASASITLVDPAPPINVTSAIVNVACRNSHTGSIDVSVTGGISPYNYLWNNGITTQDRTGLGSGIYTLTVTDASGATASASFIVSQPAALVLNSSKTNIRCGAVCSGIITIAPVGGWVPYTYVWNIGAITPTISGLCGGTYTVTVTDALGCTKTKSTTVTSNPTLIVLVTHSGSTVANASVTGGVSPYTYLWNTVPNQTTVSAAGLTPGHTYKVKVTDSKNCTKMVSIIMPFPKLFMNDQSSIELYPNPGQGKISISGVDCNNSCSIKFTLNDAVGRLIYSANEYVSNNLVEKDFSYLKQGIYLLRIDVADKTKIFKLVIQ